MNTFERVPIEAYEPERDPFEGESRAAANRHATSDKDKLKLLSYADMSAMPEPEWLVTGVIQARSAALIFGSSNAFKTFLGIDIGLSVASGINWHGQSVVQGDVLFVATEGANGVGRVRIPAWYDHHEISHHDRRGVFLYPKEIRLDVASDVSALITAMNEAGSFRLLVLDIFGGTMAGSEIEDKTARLWVHGVQRIIRETGAAILVVAHTGWQDQTRARMHTHFWGSFDSRMRVDGNKENLTTVLTVERHKDSDSAGAWGFNLMVVGKSLVPILDAEVKATSKARRLPGSAKVALQALDEALEQDGEIKADRERWPSVLVVGLEKWRACCDRHGLSTSDKIDTKRKAFQRAGDTLRDRNIIRIYDSFVWRCDR